MIYEIINPSDPYTMVAPDNKTAICACLLLSNGQYGLNDESGNSLNCLLAFCSEEQVNKYLDETFEMELSEWLSQNKLAVADALESVLLANINDRMTYEEALKAIDDPEKREAYKQKVYDKKRTSMNDIGQYAWNLAESMKKKLAQA